MPGTKMPTLKVTTTTWARDSHDLFDYEARHVNTKTFYIQQPMKAFRSGTEVTLVPEGVPNPTNADYLVRFVCTREGKFQVAPAERCGAQATSPKKLWLIVKDLKKPGHCLQEADIIKLGRFKLRVRQCVKSGDVVPELRLDEGDVPDVSGGGNNDDQDMSQVQCRICLLEGPNEDGPLIAPCQCKGSIKFVHVSCLCHWIKGRLQSANESNENAFFYRQQQCELCKTCFPPHGITAGIKIPIVQVPHTKSPFIVLENVHHTNRGLHVISMAEKKNLKLGRGHESDVRIADVSISRYHATIQFLDDNFILEDYNSKFGTLVAIRKSHVIDVDAPVSVQVGRTAVSLSIEENPPADIPLEEGGGGPSCDNGGRGNNNTGNHETHQANENLGNNNNNASDASDCDRSAGAGSGAGGASAMHIEQNYSCVDETDTGSSDGENDNDDDIDDDDDIDIIDEERKRFVANHQSASSSSSRRSSENAKATYRKEVRRLHRGWIMSSISKKQDAEHRTTTDNSNAPATLRVLLT